MRALHRSVHPSLALASALSLSSSLVVALPSCSPESGGAADSADSCQAAPCTGGGSSYPGGSGAVGGARSSAGGTSLGGAPNGSGGSGVGEGFQGGSPGSGGTGTAGDGAGGEAPASGGTAPGGGGFGGAGGSDQPPPAPYTLRIDTPANGAPVSGSVTVSGMAPGFVNVEIWDATHQNPPLAQVTPAADGSFTVTVDTTALGSGAATWAVHAWDVAPGGTPAHDAVVSIPLTLQNGVTDGGTPPGPTAFVLGAENKNGSQQDFEAAVQCDVNINQITTGWCGDWASWEGTGCGVFSEVSQFYAMDPKHAVELSLSPWPQALGGQSWGACARGDYDGHYGNLARSILAAGMRHVVVRLGYEWDGNWFPWGTGLHETGSVTNVGNGGTALDYAACFARVDGVIQAVVGAQAGAAYVRMVMNPIHDTVGTKQTQLRQVLDAAGGPRKKGGHVDFLGVDFYDYPERNNFDSRMQASIAFAREYGIPLSFPEWGVGGGSRAEPAVDDAGVLFIQGMYGYFADPANGIRYASYFNCATGDCAGNHSLIPPNNPQSNARFVSLFGNGKLGCGADARAMVEAM